MISIGTKIKIGLAAIVAAILFVLFGQQAFASPSNFTSTAQSSTATSSLVYMTVGAATTTVVYDSYQSDGTNQTNSGNTYVTNKATLFLLVNASSTLTKLNVAYEFSSGANCATTPTGCEWYADGISLAATSTAPNYIGVSNSYSWQFASSTVGGVSASTGWNGVNGTNNRNTRAIDVPTPTRYVRAVISVSGANGAIYAQILPQKETK